MKTVRILSILALAVGSLAAWATTEAADVLAGYNTFAALDAGDGAANGVYNPTGDLVLTTGASINCNDNATDQPPGPVAGNASACPITIVVTGDLEMFPGSAIRAENQVSGGNGGNISITVAGDVLLHGSDLVNPGALISSRKISGAGDTGIGGNITIHAGDTTCATASPQLGDVTVEIGAQILADSPGNPGDIEILSGRHITIDGKVSSNNSSTVGRAGRITLIACCDLRVGATGIVSSRGRDPGADLVHLEGCTVVIQGLVESTGPGHNDAGAIGANACNDANHVAPAGASFRACVEIWSGSTVLIDASSTNNGQVNADTAFSGGTSGRGWIDIYANGDITIIGNAIPPFAVHANQGVTNAHGGTITIKSKGGDVFARDLAVQADATSGGGSGGQILVEALAIDLDTASIFARGDFVATGGYGVGGRETIRAFTGGLTWTSGTGDVGPTGTGIAAASRGVILLFGCPVTLGATFPVTAGGATTPTSAGCPGGSPMIPNPAGARLAARESCIANNCSRTPPPPPFFCEKDPVRTILDNASGRFPGNQGADIVVRTDLGESIQAAIDASAAPGFDAAHNNDGYIILAVSAHADGSLGGHTSQSIDISSPLYEFPFALIGCSVTMHDPTPSDGVPTARIEASMHSPEWPPASGITAFLMDLHAADSQGGGIGWKVEAETDFDGGGRYVRNTYATNSSTGLWFTGDGNVMHNGKAEGNVGIGIKVEGNFNTIDGADSFSNGGDGVWVSGNSNKLDSIDSGDKGKGNGGNGFTLAGVSNLLDSNDAFANLGDGFNVTSNGAVNVLKGNRAGDRGKANQQNGFVIGGNGNGSIDVDSNTAKANVLNGFWLTGGNHKLKNNKSGGSGAFPGGEDNGKCEFKFDLANLDGGGNKANNASVGSFTAGSCKGTP